MFAAHEVDAVIHFAGFKSVGATMALLRAMQVNDLWSLVFSGS